MILPEPTPQFVAHRPPRSPSPRPGVRRRQAASPCRPVSACGSRRSWTLSSAASTASVEADDDDDSCSDCSAASLSGAAKRRGRGVVAELAIAVEDAFRNPWHWSVASAPVRPGFRPRLPPPTPPPRPAAVRRFRPAPDDAWVAPVAPPWWWPPAPPAYRARASVSACFRASAWSPFKRDVRTLERPRGRPYRFWKSCAVTSWASYRNVESIHRVTEVTMCKSPKCRGAQDWRESTECGADAV